MAYKETILDKIIRLCNGGLNNSSISKKDVLKSILAAISNYSEEPVSEDLEKELSRLLKDCEIDSEYIHQDFLHIVANHFANWQKEQINEVLLSEVLPCFMHGGEADEVVAKLEEVLNKKINSYE